MRQLSRVAGREEADEWQLPWRWARRRVRQLGWRRQRCLIMGVLEVLFKEPDLILHRSDQTFHFGICLNLEDFFNSSSHGNHVF